IRIHRKYIGTLQEIWHNHRREDAAAPLIANKHEGGLDDLERLLRYGQEAGEFRAFDPRTMAMVIRNAIDMVPHLMTAQFDFDIDAFAQELVSLFSRATHVKRNK
ncbi:MAG: TetR family transcriptional regulator, partial [Armatimonadetes bacterium]|nr:TetR family transcriptional regulator [Armatimonadota bacterium]